MPEFVFAELYPGLKLIDTFRTILNTGEMYKLVNNFGNPYYGEYHKGKL